MDRFVVGTGRCGSTLLSRMLACHPELLSISEFFNGLDMERRFPPRLSGDDLVELVSAPQPLVTAVLARGYRVTEVTYPFRHAGARLIPGEPLPWILVSTLPSATPDPDTLYDETLDWLRSRPEHPAADQYRALFLWWAARLGKSTWVERSGSSIDYTAELNAHFPHSRFVHLHRDGPEVALSMRDHHSYRLAVALRYDVRLDDGRRVSESGPLDLAGPPRDDDLVSRILRSRPPAEAFGRFWNEQILRGLDALEAIDPARRLTVRFETLVRRPRETLERIAAFLEVGTGPWIDRGADLVQGVPPLRSPALPVAERSTLEEACRPARERLAAGVG